MGWAELGGVAMANPGEVAGELAAKKEERSDVPGDRDDGKTKRQEGTERYGGEEEKRGGEREEKQGEEGGEREYGGEGNGCRHGEN